MALLEVILSTLLPIFGGVLIVAVVYAWCGKASSIRAGVNTVLTELSSFFKEDKDEKTPEFFEIEEREFAGFKNRVSEYFSHFVFVNARNFGNYMVVQYRIGDMQVSDEVVEQEWVNYLKSVFNVPSYIKIPVLVVHDVKAGLLYFYYAWNEEGIKILANIRNNVKSRQIPPPSDDIVI